MTEAEMTAEIARLKWALYNYTDAKYVKSWGMEEYGDDGEAARKALGFGNHEDGCGFPNGEFGECTCGLQGEICVSLPPHPNT